VTLLRQVPDQVVGDAFLEQDASGRCSASSCAAPRCRTDLMLNAADMSA
jgi:hypothetical protein